MDDDEIDRLLDELGLGGSSERAGDWVFGLPDDEGAGWTAPDIRSKDEEDHW